MTLQTKIMASHHDDPLPGHFGFEKTQDLIARKYHWNTLKVDVEKFVNVHEGKISTAQAI